MFEYLKRHQAYLEKPVCISSSSRIQWHREVHLLVVGFGAAGAAAALESDEQGMETLILERMSGGGATKISGGIYYAGGGTRIQKEADVTDSPENMFNYLKQEVRGAVSDATLKKFCQDSVENFDWIEQHGVPFEASVCPYKTSYPSNQYYFYYSGNESFPPYSEYATPAARGHRAHCPGISGAAIFEPLRNSILEKGISLQTQSKVVALLVNEKQEVIGVKALSLTHKPGVKILHQAFDFLHALLYYGALFWPPLFPALAKMTEWLELKFGAVQYLKAKRGVVLATGGYFSNQEMIKKYAPAYQGGSPLGTMCDDGSGIQLAQSLGAKTALMHRIAAWRFINPPSSFAKGVLLGLSGKRVCNEMLYGAQIGDYLMSEHQGKAWLILDKQLYKQSLRELNLENALWFQIMVALFFRHLGYKKADSLEQLAEKTGINKKSMQENIRAYNEVAASGEDDPLGKPRDYMKVLDKGPFYALNVSYDYFFSPCASLSFGGLVVNEETGQVMHENGKEIQGLYAAGRTAVGVPSNGYVSGLSLADCIFSGRRAAKHAAKFMHE